MARKHKPYINPLTLLLVKAFGKMAVESEGAKDFIYMAQKTYIRTDVAEHFTQRFRYNKKGKLLSDFKAANLFRAYCKLIYYYGSTKPEL